MTKNLYMHGERARADALADAETLHAVAASMCRRSARARRIYMDIEWAQARSRLLDLQTPLAEALPKAFGHEAARAAFRAVPGLREDR